MTNATEGLAVHRVVQLANCGPAAKGDSQTGKAKCH